MLKRSILVFLLIFASPLLQAEDIQSLTIIEERITQHVLNALSASDHKDIHISTGKIDARLKLRACDTNKLEVFNPYQTSILNATTMGIRCQETDKHWTLYVPIKISVQKTILVAKRPLLKGTQIGKDDIEIATVDVSLLKQGYFTKMEDIIGLVCKQNLIQGSAFNPAILQTAIMIHKGEQVRIQAVGDMLSVSMEGIALNDGSLGDIIKVKNLSSKRIIEAQIQAKKQVRVAI